MRRVALIGLLALAVVGCVWWITRGSPNASDPIAITAYAPSEGGQHEVTLLEQPETGSGGGRAVPAAILEQYVQGSTIPSGLRRLHGTVVVVDEHGVEHSTESGTLDLSVWNDKESVSTDMPVVAGKWELDLDRADQVSVIAGLLGGRVAYDVVPDLRRNVPVDGRIDLRLLWSSPLVLHARDSVTNRDIVDIEVLAKNGGWIVGGLEAPVVPDRDRGCRVVLANGRSPVTFTPEQLADSPSVALLYVRAPGYAWAHVECDLRLGGAAFVELTPTSAMDVELIGDAGDSKASIQVTDVDRGGRVFETMLANRARFAIDDVPVAKYRVTVEANDPPRNRIVLAESEVSLVAGSRTCVQLRLTRPAPVTSVSLTGVLRIPTAWTSQQPGVTAIRLDPHGFPTSAKLAAVLGTATTISDWNEYAWTVTNAEPGQYVLTSGTPTISIVAEVPPGGASGLLIDVPLPGRVSVQVVDADTREPAAIDRIVWRSKVNEIPFVRERNRVDRNATTNKFDFQCPLGEIEITLSLGANRSSYSPSRMTVRIGPGDNQVTMPVFRAASAAMRVMDGERVLPVRGYAAFEVSPLRGGDGPHMWKIEGPSTVAYVANPGTYRIKVSRPVAGYLTPDAQIVDLDAGATTDVVFRLTRKP